MTTTKDALPELPQRFAVWKETDEDSGAWGQPDQDVFTADQMRDYALASLNAMRDRLLNEFPHEHQEYFGDAIQDAINAAALASKQVPQQALSAPSDATGLTYEQAEALADRCASESQENHSYLDERACSRDWKPHKWVVAAVMEASKLSAQAKSEPADLQRIELSDGAWLERGGPLSIWGLYRANTGHLRELNRFEREFVDCTIRAAIAATQEQKP